MISQFVPPIILRAPAKTASSSSKQRPRTRWPDVPNLNGCGETVMKMTDVVGLIDEKAAEVAIVRRVYKERDAKLQSGHRTSRCCLRSY